MKLNEFFNNLDVTEAPKRFPEGHYIHTPGALEVMPSQDQTMWADAGELPKKFNVTKMKIAIYDEQDDEDPYSYGNGGLMVYHNAGTWKMYTDDVTRVQIADYLGIPTKDIDFSEQGMQDEEYMHFDIEDDTVAQLISKGAFKLEENVDEAHELDRADKMVLAKLMKEYEGYKSMVAKAKDADDSKMYQERLRDLVSMIKHVKGEMKYGIDTALEDELSDMYDAVKGVKEDDMSTGTVSVGKKGQTRRATGIDDNPYDHNEGEDQTALVNAALWNMKDVYQTVMSGESLSEDDMFSYGDLVQYLEQADMPDQYSKFWDLVVDAINSAGGFGGQGSELQVDKNIAPQIKTLYQQFKAATAKIKGVKEAPTRARPIDPNSVFARLGNSIQSIMNDALDGNDMADRIADELGDYLRNGEAPEGSHYEKAISIVTDAINDGPKAQAEAAEEAISVLHSEETNPKFADEVAEDTDDDYGYTWNCKKCGSENEFTMTPQEKQEYINDWEADNQDLVADGETGEGALDNLLLDQGEESGMHYGNKCTKCGTVAEDPYSEDINDILRLSGLK